MPVWHLGEVVLQNGNALKGKVFYSLEKDNLQLKDTLTGKLQTFPASEVQEFSFFDHDRKALRSFYTFPFAFEAGYTKEIFFELLLDGYYTLLSRESTIDEENLEREDRHLFYPVNGHEGMRYLDHYFLLDEKGLYALTDKKGLMAHLPKEMGHQVESFIDQKGLGLMNRPDMLKVVQYMNMLWKHAQ